MRSCRKCWRLSADYESMKTMRDFMVASHSTMAGIQAHMQEAARDRRSWAVLRRSQKR